jgi:hypothetical protein
MFVVHGKKQKQPISIGVKKNDPIWKQVHLYETVGVAGYARKMNKRTSMHLCTNNNDSVDVQNPI